MNYTQNEKTMLIAEQILVIEVDIARAFDYKRGVDDNLPSKSDRKELKQ